MSKNLDKTVEAIEKMVALFKTERIVYLVITVTCMLVLIISAIFMIQGNLKDGNNEGVIQVMGLITSSGGIIYSAGRLLKMWSEAMELIKTQIENNG